MFDDEDPKLRVSSTMKPRKFAALPGAAPCPTSVMIGPWCDGSSPGMAELNAEPADGIVRRLASVDDPRHDVSDVVMRSWKLFMFVLHGAAAPTVGPGALM